MTTLGVEAGKKFGAKRRDNKAPKGATDNKSLFCDI
jgi:hypothetical protein